MSLLFFKQRNQGVMREMFFLALGIACFAGPGHAEHHDGYVSAVGDVPSPGVYIQDQWNFDKGQCTSYVAYRLNEVGIGFNNQWRVSEFYGLSTVPPLTGKSTWNTDRWSDAWEWLFKADHIGLAVNISPAVNAVFCDTSASEWGHVAIVDSILGDGSATISEYNLNNDHQYSTRTVFADGVNSFFIHFTRAIEVSNENSHRYELVDLGLISPADSSEATAINERDEVVGFCHRTGSEEWIAFLWKEGEGIQNIGAFLPSGINNNLQVVGRTLNRYYPDFVYWDQEKGYSPIGDLEGRDNSFGLAINDSGSAVGYACDRTATGSLISFAALSWDSGSGIKNLSSSMNYSGYYSVSRGINNLGQIAGTFKDQRYSGNAYAIRFTPSQGVEDLRAFSPVLMAQGSSGYDINIHGSVVGEAALDGATSRPFRNDGGYSYILGPDNISGTAYAINDNGVVVGTAVKESGSFAFICDGDGFKDLNDLVEPKPGWVLGEAMAINNRGSVCGVAYVDGRRRAFLLRPLPNITRIVGTPSDLPLGRSTIVNPIINNNGNFCFSFETPIPGSRCTIEYSYNMIDWIQWFDFLVDTSRSVIEDQNPMPGKKYFRTVYNEDALQQFLFFPLESRSPYTAEVVAVFDHDPIAGSIIAYNGEIGDDVSNQYIYSDNVVGYPKSNGALFELPILNYNDELPPSIENKYLFYDGHTGYDYPCEEGVEILAAASGVLFLAINEGKSEGDGTNLWRNKNIFPKIDGVNYSWEEYHTFYIVHENGYSTWYLHARETSPLAPNILNQIISDGYAIVNRGDVVGYVGKKGSAGNHLHFGVRKHNAFDDTAEIVSSKLVDPYGNGSTSTTTSNILWELLPE